MHQAVVVGSGKIGTAVARMLHHSGSYRVAVADKDEAALERLAESVPVETVALDVTDEEALCTFLEGRERVLSAAPFFINPAIARAALKAGVSYFDLTEDRETTAEIKEVAEQAVAGQVFMPQCGLAPGFISILAAHLCGEFERLDDVKMRVGALPKYPSNMMMYNLTWSTDGLINEYCNPCEAIHDGKLTETMALEGLELFSLDGNSYEAFNTSGGLGTLAETLAGKVRSLNYKTVRYRGHQYLMNFLVNDLHMGKKRDQLKSILEEAVPVTLQDVVLIFCTVSGWHGDTLMQHSNARKIYSRNLFGEPWSSIQITTAAGICAVVDLHAEGKLDARGFLVQEEVKLPDFLQNRFGRHYQTDTEKDEPAVTIQPLTDFQA